MTGEPEKKCGLLHVMTDTSCGEEALNPGGTRASV